MRWALVVLAAAALGTFTAQGAVITFTDASVASGLGLRSELSFTTTVVDIDSDEDLDVMVWNFGERDDLLYRNDGAASFEDVSLISGMFGQDSIGGEDGGAFHDFDRDGRPDAYVPTHNPVPNTQENQGRSVVCPSFSPPLFPL